MSDGDTWSAGTWDGARRSQLERSLRLTVRERLEGLSDLAETSERLTEVGRAAGGEADGRHTLSLDGCRPTPLADYLKALAVLRLVGEQKDPEARGWWEGNTFLLRSRLDEDGLVAFLRDEYRPTPIVAPWNGGSGFYPKDNQSGIGPIVGGSAGRLHGLRGTISTARDVLERAGLSDKPSKDKKEALLRELRAELDDGAVRWLDAAVLLTDEGSRFPPLLGTGGNDGRLDFTNNFLQRLVGLMDPETGAPTAESRGLLEEALFDRTVPAMDAVAIGQFSPSAAGGPNATTAFEGGALVNPWDFILMLEGALLFAAAATRRLEASGEGGSLSYPFTVRPSGSGSGGLSATDEGSGRGEIWMPLWARPATHIEIGTLMGEGRATVRRRVARDGLDFARAVSTLGVARGVHEFQRFGFLQRYGRTYLATPLNRVAVRHNQPASLIDQLERRDWLSRFGWLARRKEAPARLTAIARRLDDGLFDLALRGSPSSVQKVLVALGEAMQYLAVSASARERCRPVPQLDASWVEAADDGTDEFRIALSLSGVHSASGGEGAGSTALSMISHIAPVARGRREQWSQDSPRDVVWGPRPLEANLALVMQRRLMVADREEHPDRPLASWATAPVSAVARWLAGDLHRERVAALVPGLALTRTPQGQRSDPDRADIPLPGAFRILKPFFCTFRQLRRTGFLEDEESLSLPGDLVRHLASNRVDRAVLLGAEGLRKLGFRAPRHLRPHYPDGPRLLGALMTPLAHRDVELLLAPFRRSI